MNHNVVCFVLLSISSRQKLEVCNFSISCVHQVNGNLTWTMLDLYLLGKHKADTKVASAQIMTLDEQSLCIIVFDNSL